MSGNYNVRNTDFLLYYGSVDHLPSHICKCQTSKKTANQSQTHSSCEHGTYFMKTKWNESGFRPPLCTYRLNWARRTSWRWWDDWDDTVLQTQDLKFEPWRSEAEHATSRSRRLPTILTFTRGWGRNLTPNSGLKGSDANHYPRTPAHILYELENKRSWWWWRLFDCIRCS